MPWLIAILAIVPFLPALHGPFLSWDDIDNLVLNPMWKGFTLENVKWMLTNSHAGPYAPLSWLSYGLDFVLWGPDPVMMRMTNLLIHASSAVLLHQIASELIDDDFSPVFCALIWAVHPLRVESVVWLTERRDVLSCFFYLSAVLAYIRASKPLLPLSFFCLAVLSKGSAITLPLSLIVLDAYRKKDIKLIRFLPYFAISLAFGLAGLLGQRNAGALHGFSPEIALHSAWWYAVKTIVPAGLSPYHRVPAGFGWSWPAALAVAAVLAAAWRARRRFPAVPAALAHYLIALSPMLGFVRFGHHLAAERYSYLPGLGLALLAGAAVGARRGLRPVAAAVLAASFVLTARAASWWRTDEALWGRAIALDAEAVLPRANLAGHLRRAGRLEEARIQERRVLELDPNAAQQLTNLGGDAVAAGRFDEAEALLSRAVALTPVLPEARRNLAAGRNNRGNALLAAGKPREALAWLEKARAADPDWAVPPFNLGNALTALGRHADAAAAFDEAVRLEPAFAAAWLNGGNARGRLGKLGEAAARYERALALDPENEAARRNLDQVRRAAR